MLTEPNNKNISLTVAIPAYNEEQNIGGVLKDLLSQTRSGFALKEIVVYSDASTDETNRIVKRFHRRSPVINLKIGKRRCGKIFRLNQIFRSNKSDVLVVLDADIGLVGNRFLQRLAGALASDDKAKMAVAHQIPLRSKNFMGKVVYASYLMWDFIRLSVPGRDHVQNFYGAATAYRSSFAKKLHIPPKLTEERLYIYLRAKEGNGFRYCDSAKILYWPVSTLPEFIKQAKRSFGKNQPILDKIFGPGSDSNYVIPWKYKLRGIVKSFYHQPFYTPLALAFNFFLSKLTLKTPVRNSPLWDISLSTKKPFNYEKIL